MSLFKWFARKTSSATAASPQRASMPSVDANSSLPAGNTSSRGSLTGDSAAAQRRAERSERRELLYGIVRDTMTGAGVLSASYKFKVLSLDSRGRQYLIMMDLSRKDVGAQERLTEIESMMAKNAKASHDILIASVYWRLYDSTTHGLARSSAPVPHITATNAEPKQRFEPLHDDEVAAFKQAIAAATTAVPLSAPGEIVKSGRRNPVPLQAGEFDLDRSTSPLSGTQYGDLN